MPREVVAAFAERPAPSAADRQADTRAGLERHCPAALRGERARLELARSGGDVGRSQAATLVLRRAPWRTSSNRPSGA
jgi:hypothetical protein